ncbi:MAG TPA: HAMP domain-containing sensor histidine kinase [Actinomycetota bacterium]|nr:HAMP domain-containing sensor histidine kinase [Actinomycetota bacterium]
MAETAFAELISKIAHELRSPLTAVQGFSGTLVKRWDRFDDEQRKQLVATIHSDALRMGRVISEVLDLARMETGRLELTRTEVDVGSVAEKALERVAQMPGSERLELRVADGLTAWADAGRLEHILGNLVENAVKFSEEGPVVVGGRDAGDGWVELSVSDRGNGVEPDRLDALFSGPAPAGRSTAGPLGSGLGLYLTKRLVEAHEGDIAVQSRPGEGTTFTVRLPATDPGA